MQYRACKKKRPQEARPEAVLRKWVGGATETLGSKLKSLSSGEGRRPKPTPPTSLHEHKGALRAMQDVVSNVCPNMDVHQIVTANVQIGVHIGDVIHVGIHVSRYQGRRVWITGRRWRAVGDGMFRLTRMGRVFRMRFA
jgi:hypothetical protein